MNKLILKIGMMGARRAVPLLLLVLLNLPVSAQPDTLRVLFVGNSYTYTNNLPQLFSSLAASGGQPTVVDMSAPGGYWLEQHCVLPETISKISQGIWDYVVLQEQSQVPTIDYYRYGSMYPSARYLDSLIVSYGQQTAFFLTWGRKHGGQQTINQYSSPVFRDFFHMQDSLTSAYTQIARELDATLCPVGLAWAEAVRRYPRADLWQPDDSHPTLQGTYLAACVFYAKLTNLNPVGLSYTAGLRPAEVRFLQVIAARTVFGTDESQGSPIADLRPQVTPNPFNPTTTIRFSLPQAAMVSLEVFDIGGRCVGVQHVEPLQPGTHEITFDGSALPSGVYLYRLQGGGEPVVGKMIILK
ncbi:MAG: T9SS type A sorting domain-containing protein [bacterium]|nr:T9SS type A sorting domain-containing protein [bacterium]